MKTTKLDEVLSTVECRAIRHMNGRLWDQDELGEAVLGLAHEVARGSSKSSLTVIDELASEIMFYVWPLVLDHVTGQKPRFSPPGELHRFSAEMLLRLMRKKAHFAVLDLGKAKVGAMELAQVDPDSQPASAETLDSALEVIALEEAMRSLHPLDRSISKLLAQGHSSDEVGEILNLSSQAVRNRQCRQHKRMRETGMFAYFT